MTGPALDPKKSWKYRRRYLYATSIYLAVISIYPLLMGMETRPAESAVSFGLISLFLNTFAYVCGSVIDDKNKMSSDGNGKKSESPGFLQYTNWTYRRLYLYVVTFVAFIAGGYPLYSGMDNTVAETAVTTALLGISALTGTYVFGAVFDDKNKLLNPLSTTNTEEE